VLGAGLVTVAIVIGEFSLFLAGSLVMGVTTSETSMHSVSLRGMDIYQILLNLSNLWHYNKFSGVADKQCVKR
jgi:hypothetical protein